MIGILPFWEQLRRHAVMQRAMLGINAAVVGILLWPTGRRIVVDGEAREIIGIMPQSFRFMNRHAALILPGVEAGTVLPGSQNHFSHAPVAAREPGFQHGLLGFRPGQLDSTHAKFVL